MKCSTRTRHAFAAGIVAVAAAVPMAHAVHAGPQSPDVPDEVEVPDGNKLFLVGHGVGVQIYSCDATASGAFRWSFVAPRANLYDDKGKLLTTHYGGPTWEARDGSTVVAQRDDGVVVDPTAVPWLRLSTVSTAAGADGSRLTDTTFIQRLATTGGLAPDADDCNAGSQGTTVEVPYTADYQFWKSTGR